MKIRKLNIRKFRRYRRKILAITLIALITLISLRVWVFLSPPETQAAWWNDSWSYRKPVDVTSTNGSAQSNVFISFDGADVIDTDALVTAGKLQTDCGDLRFVTEGGVVLPYYIVSGCNSTTTDIDVNFDSFPDGDQIIYFYYGNTGAPDGFESSVFTLEASNYTIGTPGGTEETGPGPVAYWKFDEGADNTCDGGEDTCDSTANANDGTFTSAPVWQSEDMCIGGKCLLLDGSDDYIEADSVTSLIAASDFTATAWIRTGSCTGDPEIMSFNTSAYANKILLFIDSNCFVTPYTDSGGSHTGSINVGDNQWHHVTLVWDDTNNLVYSYIDSQLDVGGETDTNSIASTDTFSIGMEWDSGPTATNFFTGFVDEVKIYPYARTADEVKQDYLGGGSKGSAASFSPDNSFLSDGLVGYWDFPEATGSATLDKSGNGNDGTLTNMQETGVADSGGSTTTLIDADGTLSSTDDVYIDMTLEITTGSCGAAAGESRTISDYVGGTNTITVGTAFSSSPDGCGYIVKHQIGGKFGRNLDFEGTDDVVQVSSDPMLEGFSQLTLAAWVYPRSGGQTNGSRWISKSNGVSGDDYGLFMYDDDIPKFRLQNGAEPSLDATNFGALSLNTWYHIVGTWDGNTMKIYVNGKLSNSQSRTVGLLDNNDTLSFGCHADSPTLRCFDGQIDEARIYNRVLSPAEVEKLYNWAPGPVGYWKMDEGSWTNDCSTDTVFDSSGNGNDGDSCPASTGPTGSAVGKYGKSGDFDGSDDYLSMADSTSLRPNTLSLSAWVYHDTTSGGDATIDYIVAKRRVGIFDSYHFGITNSDSLRFCIEPSGGAVCITTGTTVPLATWTHVAATWDGTTMRVFVNGVEGTATGSQSNALDYGAFPVLIGVTDQNGSLEGYFDGKIDDVRIYNYPRTQGQIVEDMNAGHPAPGSPVSSALGHWKFDEGYGDTANNSGSGGTTYDGDLAGSGTTCPGGGATCPTWTNSGKYGKALDFVAADRDYVETSGLMGQPANITLSAWAKLDSADTNAASLISIGDYAGIHLDDFGGTNTTAFYYDGTDWRNVSAGETHEGTGWHHFVYTVNDATDVQKIYVDGIEKASSYYTGSISYSGQGSNTLIGRHGNGSTTYDFDGQIDDVRIYSSALTADQVKLLYNQGSAAVWGATSSNTSGTGSSDALSAYCPPGSTDSCVGPVAEWKFNENTGTSAFDTSENGNTGTLTNGPAWTNIIGAPRWANGLGGSALFFDGASGASQDDLVNAGTDTSIDNIFTGGGSISAWIYPISDGESTTGRIFAKDNSAPGGYDLNVFGLSGNTMRLRFSQSFDIDNGNWDMDNFDINLNEWNHFALTYNKDSSSNNPIFYVNGAQVDSTLNGTVSGDADSDGNSTLYIGNNSGGTRTWDGSIDEVRLYNYTRTSAQIAWEYNRGRPIGHWKFDECQGSVANDSGSSGINGTITEPGGGSNTSIGSCGGSSGEMWADGTTGKRNASLEFDGTDDYVTLGNNFGTTTSFSVAAWTYWLRDPTGQAESLISRLGGSGNRDWFIKNDFGNWSFTVSSNGTALCGVVDGGAPIQNQWLHVVGVYDADNQKMYFYQNGKLTSDRPNNCTIPSSIAQSSNTTYIGRRYSPDSEYANALIDDVRIYNYALTQQQINDIFNSGAVRFGPNTGSP